MPEWNPNQESALTALKTKRAATEAREAEAANLQAALEAKAEELFSYADVNASGFLDKAEVSSFLSQAGLRPAMITEIFKAMDFDRSGKIDREEFLVWVKSDKETGYRATLERLQAVMAAADAEDEQLIAVFKKWDTDGSGSIDRKEFETMLSIVGLPAAKVATIFKSVDKDGNGKIDLEEFIAWTRNGEKEGYRATVGARKKVEKKDGQDAVIRKLFQQYDEDGSGLIDQSEFRDALQKLGFGHILIAKIFATIDADRSGQIDLEEFIAWTHNQSNVGYESVMANKKEALHKQVQGQPQYGHKVQALVRKIEIDKNQVDHMRTTFKRWDSDKSGKIDAAEFEAALVAMGIHKKLAKKYFSVADRDHNGRIDMEEFIAWAETLSMEDAVQVGVKAKEFG